MLLLQNQRRVTIEEGPMGTGNRHSHQLPCRQLRAMSYSLFVISSGCIDLWLTTHRNRGGVVTDFASPWTAAGAPLWDDGFSSCLGAWGRQPPFILNGLYNIAKS